MTDKGYELVGVKNDSEREVWIGGTLSEGKYVLYIKAAWKFWPEKELVVSCYGVEDL